MPAYVNDLFPLSAESSMYLSFHQSLIADRRRLLTFCKAIKQVVQPGDVVMDIGVGTGVLSLAAIQAGASKVIRRVSGSMERTLITSAYQSKQ